MPPGTVVRARKSTQTKGKGQPTPVSPSRPSTATAAEAKGPTRSTTVQVTRASVSDSSQLSPQAQTAVTAQQSPDVVQTFLFSAVSTILWMRDLLPDDYFRTAFYASINKHCSYYEFTRGSDSGATAQGDRSKPKGYHLRVLKRNASTRGDQIIKWLESGVFEGIKRGYLDQLQISIFADDDEPTQVLELYCFHFRYSGPLQDGSIAVDMVIEDLQSKKTISLKDAREALNIVVKNMVSLNGTMPHLPERCYMSPYLVWNERRPTGYQPPGFHPSSEINISFPDTDGWAMETSICGQVATGFQAVNLGIAYTKGTAFDYDGEAVVMPDFTYGEEFDRLEPFSIHGDALGRPQESTKSNIRDLPTPRPSSLMGSEAGSSERTTQVRRKITSGSFGEKGTTPQDGISANVGTQDREDLSRLKALQPIEPHQTHDTQLVYRSPTISSQVGFSAATTQEVHGKLGAVDTSQTKMAQSEPISMDCECGTKETNNSIQCHSCDCWKHAQCYAFDGPDDPRMPTALMCYTCLLGDATGEQLDEASKFTRIRQMIHCIQVRGLDAPTRIAKSLGYKRVDVVELLEELKHDNIVLLKNLKKTTEHVLLNTTEASKRVLATYLDPSKTIEDLLGEAAARRTTPSTPVRKRKGHGSVDRETEPKTPRLSRPHPNLAFDSNVPYTPDSATPAS